MGNVFSSNTQVQLENTERKLEMVVCDVDDLRKQIETLSKQVDYLNALLSKRIKDRSRGLGVPIGPRRGPPKRSSGSKSFRRDHLKGFETQ